MPKISYFSRRAVVHLKSRHHLTSPGWLTLAVIFENLPRFLRLFLSAVDWLNQVGKLYQVDQLTSRIIHWNDSWTSRLFSAKLQIWLYIFAMIPLINKLNSLIKFTSTYRVCHFSLGKISNGSKELHRKKTFIKLAETLLKKNGQKYPTESNWVNIKCNTWNLKYIVEKLKTGKCCRDIERLIVKFRKFFYV